MTAKNFKSRLTFGDITWKVEAVQDLLADDMLLTTEELMTELGLLKPDLLRLLNRLESQGLITRTSGRWHKNTEETMPKTEPWQNSKRYSNVKYK